MTPLLQARTEQKLTLAQLADAAETTEATLSRAERGLNELKASNLARVIRALGDATTADAIDRWLSA